MKSFKLREEKTFVKVLKEPPVAKKKVNWNRRLYLFLAGLAVLYVLNKVYEGHLIIQADGQIELPKQVVSFSNDVQLLDIHVEEGNRVVQGDTLFAYRVLSQDHSEHLLVNQDAPIDWILKERLSAVTKMNSAEFNLQYLRERLNIVRQSIVLKEQLVLLGLHREIDALHQLKNEAKELESEIAMVEGERMMHMALLDELDRNESLYLSIQSEEMSYYQEQHFFTSAFTGVIGEIPYQRDEICYKKDDLLTIHRTKGASINTYFDPTELEFLNEGDQVLVEFPDGSESIGVINKFFVSTYALPSEFQKKYEPTERNIVAEVIPLDGSEESVWKNYYKMDVKVQKKRYAFPFGQSKKRKIHTEHRDLASSGN